MWRETCVWNTVSPSQHCGGDGDVAVETFLAILGRENIR